MFGDVTCNIRGAPRKCLGTTALFLIYANDILDVIDPSGSIRLFAKDCVLFKHITSISDHDLLDSPLGTIENWSDKWNMKLNLNETVLRINKKKPFMFPYPINDIPISEVDY